MTMKISFPGNKKVDAHYKGFTIHTDQPPTEGGQGTAPEPFSLFLASIGTCTGIYLLSFCQERNISTEGMELTLSFIKNPSSKMIETMNIHIHLPRNFPAQYKKTFLKVANLCTVKKHLDAPPKIQISIPPN
jgi:putative redox protein